MIGVGSWPGHPVANTTPAHGLHQVVVVVAVDIHCMMVVVHGDGGGQSW